MTSTDARTADEMTPTAKPPTRRGVLVALWVCGVVLVLLLAGGAWLFSRITAVRAEVAAIAPLVTDLKAAALAADGPAMMETVAVIAQRTASARAASDDALWRAAELVPVAGPNLRAVRESVAVADDLVATVGDPLVAVAAQASPETLFTAEGAVDLDRLTAISATVAGARDGLRLIGAASAAISTTGVLPDVRTAVDEVKDIVAQATEVVTSADKAAALGVTMLGGAGPRSYLVLVMNNAELRAQGGMPGFTAALSAVDGRLELTGTASTTDFDPVPAEPLRATEPWEDALYSSDVARRLQDVTATHDFRNSARYATALAERIYGKTFDGVIAIDPYVLSYLLAATGPVALAGGETLEAGNAVNTLLRDVYIRFPQPADQDAFFSATVSTLMDSVNTGAFDRARLLSALTQSIDQDRVRLWSTDEVEQSTIETTSLSGEIPDAADGAVIGVYANDWTRSKMDYYLHAGAVVEDLGCSAGRHQAAVTVTLEHALTAEQAAALPEYVTGDGLRVPRGTIATQIVVVGPTGATIDTASGQDSDLSVVTTTDSAGRPVVARTIVLAPAASGTARVVMSWPGESASIAQVVHTPQIAIDDPVPVTTGCG